MGSTTDAVAARTRRRHNVAPAAGRRARRPLPCTPAWSLAGWCDQGTFGLNNFRNEFTPNVDIAETDKSFDFSLDLPGVKKSDLSIEINNGNISISGERKWENAKNGKNYHSLESKYGKFSRSFQLPEGINENKIDAKFTDGILNISVPKDEKKVVK